MRATDKASTYLKMQQIDYLIAIGNLNVKILDMNRYPIRLMVSIFTSLLINFNLIVILDNKHRVRIHRSFKLPNKSPSTKDG